MKLPVDIALLVPHRPPVLFPQVLTEYNGDAACTEMTVTENCPFLDDAGGLEPSASVELMAQAYAAMKGYADRVENKPPSSGYLVGVRNFECVNRIRTGDKLQVRVAAMTAFEDFFEVDGKIVRDGKAIAAGQLMVWLRKDS